MRALLLLVLVVAMTACGSSAPPPRRAPAPAPAAPKPVDDDERPPAPASIYVYSPIGKRDPFQSVMTTLGFGRPDQKGRAKTPLEKWALDQLKLSMTVTGTASPMAMVEDPEARGWAVHLGDFIGKNGGKVTGIHRDELIVTETITDHSTGRVYPQNVKLVVPVTKSEESDFNALREGEELRTSRGGK